mmetsp:Transcript_7416/g.23384  ORF Transcript_7416/g.23384 Transcript_7416/m.23384 type:complete len:310 (+) Transcript_7416:488-1417(+)
MLGQLRWRRNLRGRPPMRTWRLRARSQRRWRRGTPGPRWACGGMEVPLLSWRPPLQPRPPRPRLRPLRPTLSLRLSRPRRSHSWSSTWGWAWPSATSRCTSRQIPSPRHTHPCRSDPLLPLLAACRLRGRAPRRSSWAAQNWLARVCLARWDSTLRWLQAPELGLGSPAGTSTSQQSLGTRSTCPVGLWRQRQRQCQCQWQPVDRPRQVMRLELVLVLGLGPGLGVYRVTDQDEVGSAISHRDHQSASLDRKPRHLPRRAAGAGWSPGQDVRRSLRGEGHVERGAACAVDYMSFRPPGPAWLTAERCAR